MFKKEGYYEFDKNIFYATDQEDFLNKGYGINQYLFSEERGIPLEESEFSYFLPFLEKMGRKVIGELESMNGGYMPCNSEYYYDLPIFYKLYTERDNGYLNKILNTFNESKPLLNEDLAIVQIIKEECGFDLTKLNKIKESVKNLQKNKWYIKHGWNDRRWSYSYYHGQDLREFLLNSNYVFEEVDNQLFYNINKIKNITDYIGDFIPYEDNIKNYTKYDGPHAFEYFLFYLLLGNNFEEKLKKNLNNPYLKNKDNLNILKEIMDQLGIDDSILSMSNTDTRIHDLLIDSDSIPVWGEAPVEGETQFLMIKQSIYSKIQNIDPEISNYRINIESVIGDLVTDKSNSEIEALKNWITLIPKTDYNRYVSDYFMIKNEYVERFVDIDREINLDNQIVYTWIE